MKYIKYLLLVFPLAALIASCDEHELGYADSDEVTPDQAMLQITYCRPVANGTTTRIDSVYLNGKILTGGTNGLLNVNGTLPGTSRYYATKSGVNHLTCYNRDNIVYDIDIDLSKGRQRAFIYDFEKEPVIVEEVYPMFPMHDDDVLVTVETFDTDSLTRVRFFNFFFEDASTPYAGKLQYQYSNNSGSSYVNGDWHNIGEPVGFGEATEYGEVIVHKTSYNSAGTQTIRYRCVDADGNTVSRTTDYWTAYIGRWVTHMLRGCRTGNPSAGYTQFLANIW